ncbi:MAG: dockerin type I domain-containing protein [Candidatus Woesearchaeota archaeon]|nr:dockerin type I domain-containing protein [Candidatus Woesearchaeota archaeon]
MKKMMFLILAISLVSFVFSQTPPPGYDSRCDYYCPDPDTLPNDFWNITTTNKWCFQNGHFCEAASNYAGCEDIRHGSSGNRYWCSECRCADVDDCDAPGRCEDNSPLPTCADVGRQDCNGVPTYKDGNYGGDNCPDGCDPGPSCDGKCACGNSIEFGFCCQELLPVCGDGICNLESETCEFDSLGELCRTTDEGKPPSGGAVDCRSPESEYACTTCGDGVWQEELEECDYACTEQTCEDGGYEEGCRRDCTAPELMKLELDTCLGEGELLLYQNDQFQNPDTSFVTSKDQLLIFTRRGGNYLTSLKVYLNDEEVTPVVILSDEVDPFRVTVYKVETVPGDFVEIDAESNLGAMAIQGYIIQDEDSPVYDVGNFRLIYDSDEENKLYLESGGYDYLFFDKYSKGIDEEEDDRELQVAIEGLNHLQNYDSPRPQGTQGAVLDDYEIEEEGYYNLSIDTEDEVYWVYLDCPHPYCGDGVLDEGEECDDGNEIDDDQCSNDCLVTSASYMIQTCTGSGDLYLYSDQFTSADMKFRIDSEREWDQLLIFVRKDMLDEFELRLDGVLAQPAVVKELSGQAEVNILSVALPESDEDILVEVSSNSPARAIQAYLAQKSSAQVYDLDTLEFLDGGKVYTDYLTAGIDDYMVLDKYSFYAEGYPNDHELHMRINSSDRVYLDERYTSPSPDEGVVISSLNADRSEYYTINVTDDEEDESCQNDEEPECIMYGIQDQGGKDSIFFKLNVLGDEPSPVQINRKDDYDIEAIAKHPGTGVVYGFTGDQGESQDKKKLLVLDRTTGIPNRDTGSICRLDIENNMEFQAAYFNPKTNELWASGENTGLRVVSLTPDNGVCRSTIKVTKDFLGRPPEDMFWDKDGDYLYILYQSNSDSAPNGKILRYDPEKSELKDVCTGIRSAEGMSVDLYGNVIVGYHHGGGNRMDVYRVEENNDGTFTCDTVASKIYENVEYDDVETMFFDSCTIVPEMHCNNLYWMRPQCGIPEYTEIFCVKLTMENSACIEKWPFRQVCDFNKDGRVNDIDLTILSNKLGSTNNVDLGVYDMNGDRALDEDDLLVCNEYQVDFT